jgi:hypothetical protein
MNITLETGQRRTVGKTERTWTAHIEGVGFLYGRNCTTRRNAVLSAAVAALSTTPPGAVIEVRRPACDDSEEPELHAKVLELCAARSVTWFDA